MRSYAAGPPGQEGGWRETFRGSARWSGGDEAPGHLPGTLRLPSTRHQPRGCGRYGRKEREHCYRSLVPRYPSWLVLRLPKRCFAHEGVRRPVRDNTKGLQEPTWWELIPVEDIRTASTDIRKVLDDQRYVGGPSRASRRTFLKACSPSRAVDDFWVYKDFLRSVPPRSRSTTLTRIAGR